MVRIELIRGTAETSIPKIKLTRSKDGSTGTASFFFEKPDVFKIIEENKTINTMFLIDKNYCYTTKKLLVNCKDISTKFVQGEPSFIFVLCIFTSLQSWSLFMKFMKNYCKENKMFLKLP